MSYKTTWFSKRDLERLCKSVASLCDIKLNAEGLCDQIDDQPTNGGYGANVEGRLLREGVSREDAEMLLSELAESEAEPETVLTTAEAAKALGVNEQRIRQLCAEGRMGRKVGRTWVITAEEIEKNRVRRPGKPPGRVVTKENIEDIRQAVGFVDLAAEVQIGQRVSIHRFEHDGGQSGCLLVVHADRYGRADRAGICFGSDSAWGDWDDETQTVRLDDLTDDEGLPLVYDIRGERVGVGEE